MASSEGENGARRSRSEPQLGRFNLDFAGRHLGLMASAERRRTLPTAATTYSGGPAHLSRGRRNQFLVQHDLRNAGAVAQVEEDQVAVIAAAIYPAIKTTAGRRSCAEFAAMMRPFEISLKIKHYLCPLFACGSGKKTASSARGTFVCMPVEKSSLSEYGFQLVFAKDDDVAGGLVGGFKGFFEAKAAVAQLDPEALMAQFAGRTRASAFKPRPAAQCKLQL